MGKGLILSDIGDGLYSVKVVFDQTEIAKKVAVFERAINHVNESIDQEQAKPEPDEHVLTGLQARKNALTEEKNFYESLHDDSPVYHAWCVDLSTGLSGEVGTIEPGTELKNGINIHPGANGEAGYNQARDGQFFKFRALGPFNAALNYAMMPAIQKYKPTYRYGTLTGIDYGADTCDISLDPIKSSIQNIDINQVQNLADIPIEYMNCNARAFEINDSVVVKFENFDQAQAKVIGFKANPKPCATYLKLDSINGVSFPGGYSTYSLRITQPIPTEINHAEKGIYTEDFVVIGEATIDSAGVAEIQQDFGVTIDPDYPLNVGVMNSNKWTYYTTDWRGDIPDRGYEWEPYYLNKTGWTYYPDDWDSGEYDFLVDVVRYVQNPSIDLRTENTESFQNANGDTVSGYVVSFDGIKMLQREHSQWYLTEIDCHDNENYQQLTIVQYVPRTFDNQRWNASYYNLSQAITCWSATGIFQCQGGNSGEAVKHYYYPVSVGSGWSTNKYDMGIMTDRLGQNKSYTQSFADVEIENDFECVWMWNEDIGGYVCVAWSPPTYVWSGAACQPGELCETGGPCDLAARYCNFGMSTTGESMFYKMIDLSADEI